MPQNSASDTSSVCIAHELGMTAPVLLERALQGAGFWSRIDAARNARTGRDHPFRIVIKPDLGFYDATGIDGTDPRLVEMLIDLLHDRGCADVVVGDGRNEAEHWLHNREPLVLPDLAGYRFCTAKGRAYEFVDLGEASADEGAHDGAPPISPYWLRADFRISFAKNRTHEDSVFALGVHNLAGVVAEVDACGRARRRDPVDDCLQVLRRAPPHFTIIDGFISCHGGAGQRAPLRIDTRVFIASDSALLADWMGAAKMGADPYASPVNAAALRALGLPARYELVGDLAPYALWRNVHPLLAHTARLRGRSEAVGRIAASWFQTVDSERFPLRDFYNDRINAIVAPLMAQVDHNPRAFLAVVFLNWLVSRLDVAILAQRALFAKNKLQRRVAPLTIELARYGREAYECIPAMLRPCEQLLEALPTRREGFRWRHLDGAVIFGGTHVFAVDFDDFASKVNITRAIQYMNDYIGGSTVAVRRDRRGRVVQQAERNIYLQQPNWIVAFGGSEVDVEKLEFVDYGKNSHSIHWRTVASANGSAIHDDGRVSFVRSGKGQTTVSIFARQQFALPLFFQVFDVDLAPGVRDPIIERAYAAYFAGTIANLQAAYDGREFRIGRDAPPAVQSAGVREGAPDVARLLATAGAAGLELLRHRGDAMGLGQWLFESAASPSDASPTLRENGRVVDSDGFTHVAGMRSAQRDAQQAGDDEATRKALQGLSDLSALVRDAPDFLSGLADAMHKDLDRIANPPPDGAAP